MLATEDPPLPWLMGDVRILNPAIIVGRPLDKLLDKGEWNKTLLFGSAHTHKLVHLEQSITAGGCHQIEINGRCKQAFTLIQLYHLRTGGASLLVVLLSTFRHNRYLMMPCGSALNVVLHAEAKPRDICQAYLQVRVSFRTGNYSCYTGSFPLYPSTFYTS